jgi:hypothetical protein
MNRFLALVCAIVVGAALVYAGIHYGQQHPTATTVTPSVPATPSPSPSPALTTYKDPATGFSVGYPQELSLSSAAVNYPVPGSNVHGQVFAFPDSYATNTKLVDASISACAVALPDASGTSNAQAVTLGGRSWTLSTGTDHGAGQIYSYRAYSTAQGSLCYRVFLSAHSTDVEPKGQLADYDEAHFEDVLAQMVASFQP